MNILLILSQLVYVSSLGSDNDNENKKSISHGEPYDYQKYPYVVLIIVNKITKGFTSCSGTLVTSMFVLTAGHCIPQSADRIKIYRGNLAYRITRRVQKIYLHPEFDYDELLKDVGMMKLEKPFKNLKKFAVLYRGDGSEYKNNKQVTCQLVGFGITPENPDNMNGYMVTVKTRHGPSACAFMDDGYFPGWNDSICIRNQLEMHCIGDSGGPMFCNGYLYGVCSGSIFPLDRTDDDCGDMKLIGRHMFVRNYLKYITDIMHHKSGHHHHPNLGNTITPYSNLNTMLIMICSFVIVILNFNTYMFY